MFKVPDVRHPAQTSSFERLLSVATEEVELTFGGIGEIRWEDFLLNPRRLRGSDFLMRWSQGRWSEQRIIEAVNSTQQFRAMAYGPSGVAPEDVYEFERYFERLDQVGLGRTKRPDILVFRASDWRRVKRIVAALGGAAELPFTSDHTDGMRELLKLAVVAIEAENSLWRAKRMPDFDAPLRPQRRLNGMPGLKASAVTPTVILKEEDLEPLRKWQHSSRRPIHIWHAFYDIVIGISLNQALRLIERGYILADNQTFQAPGGATTTKRIYKIYHHYAYVVAESAREPELIADYIEQSNGHILPYVRFAGGRFQLTEEALRQLRKLSRRVVRGVGR